MVVTIGSFAGFGIDGFFLKLFGKYGSEAIKQLKNGIRYSLLTTGISIVLLIVFGLLTDNNVDHNLLLLTPIILSSLVIVLVTVKFQLEQNYRALTIWQPTQSFLRFIGIIIILFSVSDGELNEYIYKIFLVSSIAVSFIGSYFALNMYKGNIRLVAVKSKNESLELLTIFQMAKGAWPFGMATFFHLLYFQSARCYLSKVLGPQNSYLV